MKFAICNAIYDGWPLTDAMSHAARTGYTGIEIAPYSLSPDLAGFPAADRRRVREEAARLGLEICGIHLLLVNTTGLHLNHPDADVRRRTSRHLRDLVHLCADLEGRTLVLGSPKQRVLLPGVTPEQAWQWAAETLREAVAASGERGVIFCFEPLGPAETDFINTAEDALRFIRPFQSPHLKIILDVKAMLSEGKPVPDIIRASWPHFAHFHANDQNLKPPGFGGADYKPIAAALKNTGYDGWVSVESLYCAEPPELIARRSLEYLREVFA